MNEIIKFALKKTFTDEFYDELQLKHRKAVIRRNEERRSKEDVEEQEKIKIEKAKLEEEKRLKRERKELLRKEELEKAQKLKEEKREKAESLKEEKKKLAEKKAIEKKKINTFHENFREIMEAHNIYAMEDNTITPFNIQLLNEGGAEGVSCDLAFPKGLSIDDLTNKTTKALSQNVFGKCMVFIEDDTGKHVSFSAIKQWHDIKYDPYLEHNGKKLTASQIFCGYNIRLEPIVIDMASAPHLMITGGSGGGKSKLVEIIITNLAMCNTPEELNFYFLQVAKDDNFKFELLEHCKGCVTSSSGETKLETLQKALAMLKHIDKEISRREKLVIGKLGRKSEDINIHIFNKKFPNEKMPVIQLWVDEAASLYKKTNDKKIDDIIKQAQLIIERVASTGRYIGVYLINVLQRASKDELPREIKINTLNWISFKQVDAGASKVAIGDETSTLGLPQRVFAFKAGTEYVSFAKTPFTRWDTNVSYLEAQGKIREDNQDVFDDVYSVWWSKSIDRNKNSIEEAKGNSKGNILENEALKMVSNKNSELVETIKALQYERDQQSETISELLRKNSDILKMLHEQNKVVGQMVKESAMGTPISIPTLEEKSELDITELTKLNYKNADEQRKNVVEEINNSDVSVSPYKQLNLSDIKLKKKN